MSSENLRPSWKGTKSLNAVQQNVDPVALFSNEIQLTNIKTLTLPDVKILMTPRQLLSYRMGTLRSECTLLTYHTL
uniref:AlNc14C33G3002 protein n=1 Tax=Albugo laibachii Nc14 TaxID=890382 RepID=F0W8A8_9STRA|nr:AlNc14C33G3002 [Albugo laibachii Nc14]|eukprot:CCA17308.1 AlNc14C33G3002 [Albugo laibachii Nc14]